MSKIKRGDGDPTSSLNKDKRTGGHTRGSKKDKRIDGPRKSSKKRKRNLSRGSKKDENTSNDAGKTTESLMSDRNEDLYRDLESLGYPERPKFVPNMILCNTFEETFGDTYDEGVWSELSETISSKISRNVVSLASFHGETRKFVCTGFFIEWNGCTTILTSASLVSDFIGDNDIAENLRIEVLLPNKQHRKGTLQHYNLHYNVALVSVKDLHYNVPLVSVKDLPIFHPSDSQHQRHNQSRGLVAVGRCFKSGILMAAKGQHTKWSCYLDCKLLQYSTCKIAKAGIGGPLVDFDGNFIGMNFFEYNGNGTPFLPWSVILDALAYFEIKRTVAEVGDDAYPSDVLDWTIFGDGSVRPNRVARAPDILVRP
ncbi:hypothetical protein ACP70R_039026 [Stipagrostis hirtigluma subsp. patula]